MAPSPPVRAAVISRSRRWRSSWRASSSRVAGVASSWPARRTISGISSASSGASPMTEDGCWRCPRRRSAASRVSGEVKTASRSVAASFCSPSSGRATQSERNARSDCSRRSMAWRAPLPVRGVPAASGGTAEAGRAVRTALSTRSGEMPSRLDASWIEAVAEDALWHRLDDRADLRQRLVVLASLEDALDREARERDRGVEQRAHALGAALLPHDVGRVGARRERDDAELHAVREHGRRLRRGLLARRVGVEAQQHHRREALELARLLGRQRRAHRADRVGEAGLVERDDVGVALRQHDGAGLRRRRAGEVGAEQLAALRERLALAGVDVLRPLAVPHRARPEAPHPPARVGQREHDLAAEDVVEPPLAPPHRQPGRVDLLVLEARAPRRIQHRVPRRRRVADPELPQRRLGEAALEEVLTRVRRLPAIPTGPAA